MKTKTITCPTCNGSGKIETADNKALKKARADAGLSLRALGARMGYSAPYVLDIERGARRATPEIVAKWAAACEVE